MKAPHMESMEQLILLEKQSILLTTAPLSSSGVPKSQEMAV